MYDLPSTAGTGAAVHSVQSSLFKSLRSFWHVWVCWSQPDDTVFIQDGEMCETIWQPNDAAAVTAHLAIRSCRGTSCPGSGLCQGRRSRPGRRGRRRLPPSTLPCTRSTPSQWNSSHYTRRGLSSCWDMYSPCEGGNRERNQDSGYRL